MYEAERVAAYGRPRRRRPLLLVLVLVLAVVAGLGAVTRGSTLASALRDVVDPPAPRLTQLPAAPGRPTYDDGAADVVARLTAALRRHDADAFASVGAAVPASARAHLRQVYAGLAALPLTSFRLAVDEGRRPAPVPGSAPGATTLPVVATYRLQGWDDADLTVPLLLVVAPDAAGRWRVVDDRTATDAATDQRLEPWLLENVAVTRTAHVLVVGDRGHGAQAGRLARTLEAVVADVRRVWPERTWNGRVVVYAMTSTRFVRSWYGRTAAGDPGNGDRAAFVAKVVTLPGSGTNPGPVRMVVTPYLLERPASGSVDVLRHELTHVATARLGSGVPTWLVEGAAEYTGFARHSASGSLDAITTFGGHGLTGAEVASTASGRWRPTLVALPDFYTGSEAVVDEHYNSAFITCLYIADHYGEATLRRLYERAGAIGGSSRAGTALAPVTEAAALSQVLHTTRSRLVTAVSAYATALRNRLVFR